jgi:hypothetical protein
MRERWVWEPGRGWRRGIRENGTTVDCNDDGSFYYHQDNSELFETGYFPISIQQFDCDLAATEEEEERGG